MEPTNNQILLIIPFFSLIFYHSAQAICVSRNFTYPDPSPPSNPPPKMQPVSSSPRLQREPLSSMSAPPPDHFSGGMQPVASPRLQPEPLSPMSAPPPDHVSASTPVSNPPSESVKIPHPFSQMLKNPSPGNLFRQSPQPISAKLFTPVDPAIKKICDTTDNPSLCLSSVTPYLNGKTDAIYVLEMVIKACAQHAKLALAVASRIANAHGTPSIIATILNDCIDSYNDAMDNLQSSLDAIPSIDTGTINSMLSAAVTDFGTCEDGFAEASGGSSPLADYDLKLSKMASNCLAIASLIK